MNEETQKKIAELEAQLTPRGAFEAAHFGGTTEHARRFCETYAKIRELEGRPVKVEYPKET